MKLTISSVAGISLLFLLVAGCQNEVKQTDQQKQIEVAQMMKDSSKLRMAMDHISSDYHLQGMMMQRMIKHAKSDRVAMTQIGKMMTDDMEMRSLVHKMTGGGVK